MYERRECKLYSEKEIGKAQGRSIRFYHAIKKGSMNF